MDSSELPAEFAELERMLTSAAVAEPPTTLRTRVLAAVRTEFSRRRQRAWEFAVALAISALVWLNLSLSGTSDTDYRLRAGENHTEVVSLAAQLRELLPECSDPELARQALVLRCGSRLILTCFPTADAVSLRARAGALDQFD